jgi:cytochrome c oxidase assembly factor CtaG
MSNVASLDRTTRRIAAAGSLIAGAVAAYWLIEILRDQVPAPGAHVAKVNIAYLALLALFFGLVAGRPEIADRSTIGPFLFAPLAAVYASRLVFSWGHLPKHDFGLPGIMTFAVTVGLAVAAILVRERWRRAERRLSNDRAAR